MSDQDANLQIGIGFTSDTSGAAPAEDKLELLKSKASESTKELMKDQSALANQTKDSLDPAMAHLAESEQEAAEGGEKAGGSLREMHRAAAMLNQIAPGLGDALKAAMHPSPMLVSMAALGAVIGLWREYKFIVEESTKSLGGFAMADISESAIESVDKAAKAYGRLAEASVKAQDATNGINRDLDQMIKTVKSDDAFFKALGIDTGTNAKEQEAALKRQAAEQLEAEGKRKIAAAGAPGSKEAEEAVGKQYKAAADQAEKNITEIKARLDIITAKEVAQSGGPPMGVTEGITYLARYGTFSDPSKAREEETANLASQQAIIDRYGDYQKGAGGRNVRRDELASGKKDLEEAEKLQGEVLDALRDVRNAAASALHAVRPMGTDIIQIAEYLKDIAGHVVSVRGAAKAAADQHALLDSQHKNRQDY